MGWKGRWWSIFIGFKKKIIFIIEWSQKKKHKKLVDDYSRQKEKHLEKLASKMLDKDEKLQKLKGKQIDPKFLNLF